MQNIIGDVVIFLKDQFFFFFFGCTGSLLLCMGFLQLRRAGATLRCGARPSFSLRWLLLLQGTGSTRAGFTSCGMWVQQLWLADSRVQAQQLWCTGLAAPWHVGSSRTRARTRVPCIGRQILNHCATREAPRINFLKAELLGFPGSTENYRSMASSLGASRKRVQLGMCHTQVG